MCCSVVDPNSLNLDPEPDPVICCNVDLDPVICSNVDPDPVICSNVDPNPVICFNVDPGPSLFHKFTLSILKKNGINNIFPHFFTSFQNLKYPKIMRQEESSQYR